MTQRDVLREAAAAMRQQYDGQHSGSGFTRARIMRSLQARRRRSFSVWWLTPATILIVGSTAWASATGRVATVTCAPHCGKSMTCRPCRLGGHCDSMASQKVLSSGQTASAFAAASRGIRKPSTVKMLS